MRLGFLEQLSPNAKVTASIVVGLLWLCPLAINAWLLALALVSLLACLLLLWRRDQPPALMLICVTQWLQGAAKLIYAEWLGRPLWQLPLVQEEVNSTNVERACALTLIWVIALAIGIRVGWRNHPRRVAPPVSVRAALLVYLGWWAVVQPLAAIAPAGARSIVMTLLQLRVGPLYVLYVAALGSNRSKPLLAGLLAFEIGLGFLSYFSDFRTPLALLVIALLAREPKVRLMRLVGVFAVGALTLFLGVVWISIREDYRDRITRGERAQIITVSTENQINELSDLMSNMDSKRLGLGVELLIARIAYIDYFALTLDYVPRVRDHEGGRIWLGAIQHVLLPRILFPNKAVLASDSEIAQRYTGCEVTSDPNTSITIGVPAEAYVDFGDWGMLGLAFALGLLYGGTYLFISRRTHSAYAEGLAVAIAVGAFGLGPAATKTLGSALTLTILAFVVGKTLLPWLLNVAEKLVVPSSAPRPRQIRLPPVRP